MMKFYAGAIALLCCVYSTAKSQDLDSLLNLSAFTEESELQKVLNQNTTVSSSKALTTRETPGVISLITSEEIQNSGARDLTDILRLVPGFEVAQDLQFVLGIGLRGSWANEGKVAVMMDGMPFNELLYQGVALGNRFPVDAIERIEIIRGPGSAIYGGSAEYGVVNIITKAAEKLKGVTVYGVGGFHENATGRMNQGVMIADRNETFAWDVSLFRGKGIVSNGYYNTIDGSGADIDLAKTTHADPLNVNLGFKLKGLQVRGMYERFETGDPINFVYFTNTFIDVKYDLKVNSKLVLTPQFRYFNQLPFQYGYIDEYEEDGSVYSPGEDYLKVRAIRTQGSISGSYDVSKKINVNFGALYFVDKAEDLLEGNYFGENTISFNNIAFFTQGLFKHRLANATVGVRYEKNNQYGDAFVPRIALTKKIENFHFKVLYSQAFRAPSLENINLSEDRSIKPEKSQVYELELGYQFTPEMLLAVNAYQMNTKNVIVYDAEGNGLYQNFDKSGSHGVELVYNIRKPQWYANITYSLSIAGDNTVAFYEVPQTSKQFIGMPLYKFTLNTNFKLNDKLSINPSLIASGKRYAYTSVDEEDEPVVNEIDSYVLANVFVNSRDILPGLTAGVGVFDLLNEKPVLPQAYNGGYAPVPGRSREFVVKLSYTLSFSK